MNSTTRNADITIYQQPQAAMAPEALINASKDAFEAFAHDARSSLLERINQSPGSRFGTDLYRRFAQAERQSMGLAASGNWQRALLQLKQQYNSIMSMQPIVSAGSRGVGSCCSGCASGKSCSSGVQGVRGGRDGVADEEKQVFSDFMGLLQRAISSRKEGDQRDADAMLARAKGLIHRLGPNTSGPAKVLYGKLVSALAKPSANPVKLMRRGQAVNSMERAGDAFRGPLVQGVGYASDVGLVPNSWADDVNKRLDDVLTQAQNTSTLRGAFSSSTVLLSPLTGEAQQQETGRLLDALIDVMNFEREKYNGGFIEPEEHDFLVARTARIRSFIAAKGRQAWQETSTFRKVITQTAAYGSAFGLPGESQSGEDVVAHNAAAQNVERFFKDLKERTSVCWDALVNGSIKSAWTCLPTVGKAVVVGAAALGAYKASKVIRA